MLNKQIKPHHRQLIYEKVNFVGPNIKSMVSNMLGFFELESRGAFLFLRWTVSNEDNYLSFCNVP